MAHAKNHDYHILPPSIWPFLASVSAFVMLFGATLWMKGSAPWMFLIVVNVLLLIAGAFMEPTILDGITPNMRIYYEETFGPVVTLQRFATEQEAVALANDSIYGLGASIWTRDLSKALRIAPRIEAGLVWINEWGALGEDTEEGGSKQSGLGRLNGVMAIDDFTEIRTITLNPGLMDA